MSFRARVEKGRLVLDEPTTLPEGTLVELVADDESDDLTEDERRALHEALSQSWESRRGGSSSPSVGHTGRAAPQSLSLPVRTTPEADAQIRDIDRWWRTNRPSSPGLFADELAASFEMTSDLPQIGRLYRESPVPGTRRVLLPGTRYHVYYVPCTDDLRVLAVWHTQRGTGPPLRALG